MPPIAVWLLLCASTVLAADGDFDLSFGGFGLYVTFPGYSTKPGIVFDSAVSVLAQSDGKVVLVGNVSAYDPFLGSHNVIGVARLLANGKFDSTFGDNAETPGEMIIDDGISVSPTCAALSADGHIVIAGATTGNGSGPQFAAVWRLDTSGVLDPTFGNGGLITIDRGVPSPIDSAVALVVGNGRDEPLNSVFLAATVFDGDNHTDFALFFLDAAGNPATEDVLVGNSTLPNGGRYWRGSNTCPDETATNSTSTFSALSFDAQYFNGQSNHYLVASGTCGAAGSAPDRVVVAAFGNDSNLDTSFGGTGYSYFTFGSSIAAEPSVGTAMQISFAADGSENITVVGYVAEASDAEQHVGVARLLSGGQFDTTFADDGRRTIDFGDCCGHLFDMSTAQGVFIQYNGKIVIGVNENVTTNAQSFALLRLNPQGGEDATFGSFGSLVGARLYPPNISLPNGFSEPFAIAFTAGEKILLAGLVQNSANDDIYFGAVRVDNDRIFTNGFEGSPIPPP